MEQIKDKVRNYVVENFLFGDDTDLENSTSFLGGGIIDSTGVLELVQFISNEFSITIEDQELVPDNLDSIENIANFLVNKNAVVG